MTLLFFAQKRNLLIPLELSRVMHQGSLRVLLIAAKKLSTTQGKLVLCDMHEHIHEVFMISGFDQLIPIQNSRKASMNLF